MSAADQADWLRGGWILTHSGKQFWPLTPRIDDIDIKDIAHSLALQCRYNGHSRTFYSVAEHSVLISRAVAPEHALWGLLHDAAEAYVGDMVRPLKRSMPAFCEAEDRILDVIACKFGLPSLRIPAAVHDADARILLTERAALLNLNGHRWDESIEQLKPLDVAIESLPYYRAEYEFMKRFTELTR